MSWYESVIPFVYKLFFYFVFLVGWYRLFSPVFDYQLEQIRTHFQYRMRLNRLQLNRRRYETSRLRSRLNEHIRILLQAVSSRKVTEKDVYTFQLASVSIAIVAFVLFFNYMSITLAVFSALFVGVLPYLALRALLVMFQAKSSYDFFQVLLTLLTKYRTHSKDIYFALRATLPEIESPFLKRVFTRLFGNLQMARDWRTAESTIKEFSELIGTGWAKQLGSLIISAYIEQKNIEASLVNMIEDMSRTKSILEEEKSENQETIWLGFLPLVLFPLALTFFASVSGKLGNFWHYQFGTSAGLTMFTITLIVCVVGFLISLIMMRPKNEL